jgi:WD40 repeat protein
VAFSPDGRTFLTGSEDALARLWLTATHTPIDFPRNSHSGTVRAVAFSPDGQRIVTGSAGDRAVARVWVAPSALASGAVIPQQTVAVSPDGKSLLGLAEQTGRLWDIASRRPLVALPPGDRLIDAAFSRDGKTLIILRGGRVEFRNPITGRPQATPWHRPETRQLRPDVDGKTLWLVARVEGIDSIQRWQLSTGKPVGSALRHPPGLAGLDQSDDGRLILAWSGQTGGPGVRVWETTGKLLGHYVEQEEWVETAAFRPGGKALVTAGRSEVAQLWESETGKPIGPPLPHPSGVMVTAFSRDGGTLLTGCRDGTARLWDVATGKPLGPPLPHRGRVLRVGFLPDGKEVWTSSEASFKSVEGTTAFWDVPGPFREAPERVLLELQALTGMELDERGAVRKLSAEEWLQRRQQLHSK